MPSELTLVTPAYSVPDECPQEIADLLAACLYAKPAERPSAAEIVLILRDHLGSARQPPLLLETPIRLHTHSDYSFSMDKVAEQMSTRGAEAVQFRARRFGKSHSFTFVQSFGKRNQSLRRCFSLPGSSSGLSPGTEDVESMHASPAVFAPDAADAFQTDAFHAYKTKGIMASPFGHLTPPSF
jgi:hypothetical protein